MAIGTSPDMFDNGNNFYGQIDEVVIYDKPLTQDEVSFRYNNGTGTEFMSSGIPPTWSLNSTSSSGGIGEDVLHSVRWDDDNVLSGYIFSTNMSGSWVNDSWVPMTGYSDWSNVTKTVPDSNTTIGWQVFANNSFDGWNSTPVFSYDISTDVGSGVRVAVRFWTDLNATVPYYNNFLWVYATPNCTWWQNLLLGETCNDTNYYHAKYVGGTAVLNLPSSATYDLHAVDGAVHWACSRCAPNVTSFNNWVIFDEVTPSHDMTLDYFWNTTTEGQYPLFSNPDWNFWMSIGGIVALIVVASLCAYFTENWIATLFIIILCYILLKLLHILTGAIFFGLF